MLSNDRSIVKLCFQRDPMNRNAAVQAGDIASSGVGRTASLRYALNGSVRLSRFASSVIGASPTPAFSTARSR